MAGKTTKTKSVGGMFEKLSRLDEEDRKPSKASSDSLPAKKPGEKRMGNWSLAEKKRKRNKTMLRKGVHMPYLKAVSYLLSSGMTQAEAQDGILQLSPHKVQGANRGDLVFNLYDLQSVIRRYEKRLPAVEAFLTPSQKSRHK